MRTCVCPHVVLQMVTLSKGALARNDRAPLKRIHFSTGTQCHRSVLSLARWQHSLVGLLARVRASVLVEVKSGDELLPAVLTVERPSVVNALVRF